MEIYLRHESSADALLLESCVFSEIPNLICAMEARGVYWDSEEGRGVYREMDYQFVLDAENAYAEIILHGEPQ